MPSTSGAEPGPSSLYALGIQAQDIAGEIALAAELLATDDPEQEASAIALIEEYLAAQHHTAELVTNKADAVCRYIDHLDAVARFRKEQSQRLAELADADMRRAESLKRYTIGVLTRLYPTQRKFSLPTHELVSRSTSSVVIDDESALPTEFMRSKVTTSPDKAAIKASIKVGCDVPGARLESRTSWTIK